MRVLFPPLRSIERDTNSVEVRTVYRKTRECLHGRHEPWLLCTPGHVSIAELIHVGPSFRHVVAQSVIDHATRRGFHDELPELLELKQWVDVTWQDRFPIDTDAVHVFCGSDRQRRRGIRVELLADTKEQRRDVYLWGRREV